MEDFTDIDYELACFLLECVEQKRYTWTYAEVAEVLSERLNRPVNAHFHLNHPLGKVVYLCFDLELPFLSAIVRHGGINRRTIGSGFYELARELRPQYKAMEPYRAWQQELALVRSCRDWSSLRRALYPGA